MKKVLITIAILLLALMGQAQIKVHDNGHVSLGCLTQAFGVQVLPSGYTYFRTQINDDYSWANLSMANKSTQKHWIVENQYNPKQKGKKQFYVLVMGRFIQPQPTSPKYKVVLPKKKELPSMARKLLMPFLVRMAITMK